MSLNRRKFIQFTSVATAGITLSANKGFAALLNEQHDLSAQSTELFKNFIDPPQAARSACYWWWFNGLVDHEGITRDLEEFKAKGIGEVVLINSAGGLNGIDYPQGAKMLSEEWKELYRFAMKEAKRLDIPVGINLCSGWCMGGPWIKPENSGRWYLQSELRIAGPQKFSGKLPLPGNRSGYDSVFNPPGYKEYIDLPLEQLDYRDSSVVAIPDVPNNKISGERSWVLAAKTNHKDASNWSLATNIMGPTRYPWVNAAADRVVPLNKVIDLTGKVGKDGSLKWEVPAGKWKIVRTGHRMTGSRLMVAQPEADGLSIDWFDRKGVELQFENLGRVFIDEAAKVGNKPKYFCDDSFEDGFPNWTANILKQFKKYRGYDATPYLPVLSGYLIGSAEISDRFLTDYRKTLADCMADEHYSRFAELCHNEGILMQNEAAGPNRSGTVCMDGLKNLGRSDFPMGEFWLGTKHEDERTLAPEQGYGVSRLDYGQNKTTKMVSSAAHIYGRETVSAEAFTSYRHWIDYPGSLKQALDRAFCEGVNRIALHTSTASRPKDGKPGYEYAAGTHFNPNVTWWDQAGGFLNYVARSQYLLRAGKFVADVLFYNGDSAPNLVLQKHIDPMLGAGYDYDVCNEEVLLTRLSVKNGRIVLPDGMSYRILVLPESTRMPVPVLKKIAELVENGATVIGDKPAADSGLKNYPQCDTVLKTLAAKVWGPADGKRAKLNHYGSGRMFLGEPARAILLADGVYPDFEYTANEGDELDFIHRTITGAECYFVSNKHGKAVNSVCTFRQSKHAPEIWDAVTGKVAKADFKLVNGRTEIVMKFDVFQSWWVVFPEKETAGAQKAGASFAELKVAKELTDAWKVEFDPKWGGPKSAQFNSLTDWSTHSDERIKYYSGKAQYKQTFEFNGDTSGKLVYLDLGTVKNIAQVTLNGKNMGIVWTAPWRADISEALKQGENKLEIEVINQWPNRLIGDAALPPEKRLTKTNIVFKKDDKLLPSGLLGPVRITMGNWD